MSIEVKENYTNYFLFKKIEEKINHMQDQQLH